MKNLRIPNNNIEILIKQFPFRDISATSANHLDDRIRAKQKYKKLQKEIGYQKRK